MCKKLIFLTSFLLVLGLVGNAMAQIDPAAVETGHVYLLEDVNDGTVSDDSANDNAGVIVGEPQLVDGLNGKALQFDGVDDGVHIPDSDFINVNAGPWPNRTIIAVFNCADVTKQEKQTVFEEGGLTRGLTIYVFDGQVYVGGWNKAEYQWNPGSWLSAPINSNQWYTVSLVIRNGADAQEGDKFEMWLDGNFIGIAPGGQLYNHGNDNAIGYTLQNNVFHDGDASGDGWYFEGMIDEVWILNEALELGTIPIAIYPTPANGEVDVKAAPTLSWTAPEDTFQHDLYLGTDADLVAAGDASVLQGSLSDARFAVDVNEPLSRGTTYYWKVDVTTGTSRASEFHPGNVWSFRIADENTDSWVAAASKDSPAYLDTFVEDGLYDIGTLGGEITYEFVVLSNPDETEASMCLIGRRQFGDTQAGLKFDQWNDTGEYGATVFGVVDLYYGIPNNAGEYTHLAFVSSETTNTTALYVNGALAGSVDSAITLSGIVGIGYGAQGEDMSGSFDNFDGTIFGVAIYDGALTDEQIAAHSDSYFNPVKEIIPVDPGTEGLVAYYAFENDANDSSGNEIHGTLVGDATFAEGPTGYGMALDLDGDGDYVDCGLNPLLDITEQITFTYWIKAVALDKGWNTVLSRGDDSWRSSRAGEENFMEAAVGGTSGNYLYGVTLVDDDNWHHVGAVYDGATFFFYVDGKLDSSEESTGSITISSYPLYIGNNSQNTDREWTGLIDEVMIYNRALSDLEVMYLAGKRATPVDPGTENLLAWWACDEGEGAVVGDVSGNGRDGAFVFGDPVWVEGVRGNAVELVGPTLIEVPPLGMELAEATMAGWILPYGPQPDWSSIIMHRGTGLAHGFNVILPGYQLAYHWNDDSGSWSFRGGDMIAEDDWTFAAVTIESDKATFYVNGEAGSVNELAHAPAMWDNNIYLGGDGNENWIGRRMNGALDDVVMYDRALSAGEIRYLAGFRPPLVAALAFGSRLLECPTYNDPDVNYTIVLHESVEAVQYDPDRGYGYEVLYPVDSPYGDRAGYGIFGPFDDSPNGRNEFPDECPEELYDSFIGAKSFLDECSAAVMGDMDTPCDVPEGIIFRVDVPNGLYRFVGAFGEADNRHAHRILAEDGGSGPPENIGPNHVVLVSNHDQAQYDIGEIEGDNGDAVFALVGFDGKIPPPGDGVVPSPVFVDMDENGMPTSGAPRSPTLEVTQGYIRIHQLQGNSNDGPGGPRDANGGDIVILELWKLEPEEAE